MKNFWGGLSSMQKIIAVIIFMVLIWFFYNRFKGALMGAASKIKAGGEIAQLENAGIKPSYSDSTFEKMADDLFEAMDGIGTDTATVFSTFKKLKNDADFIKLNAAFGVRAGSDNLFGLMEDEDLAGWIKDDLSSTEITKLNGQLKAQGISKSF